MGCSNKKPLNPSPGIIHIKLYNMIEAKIKEIIGEEPKVGKPAGNYVPAVQVGDLIFTSGQIPFKGDKLMALGKVGKEVTPEEAYQCAQQSACNGLGAIKGLIGNLEMIDRIVKVTVFVNSAPGFTAQPAVANGASDFLAKIFGENGKHARAAVGVAELPLNAPVELEMIVSVKGK